MRRRVDEDAEVDLRSFPRREVERGAAGVAMLATQHGGDHHPGDALGGPALDQRPARRRRSWSGRAEPRPRPRRSPHRRGAALRNRATPARRRSSAGARPWAGPSARRGRSSGRCRPSAWRARTWRYWAISNLLQPTACSPAQKPGRLGAARQSEMPASPWEPLAPKCRKYSGSIPPTDDTAGEKEKT